MKSIFILAFIILSFLHPLAAQPVPANLWRGEVFVTLTSDTTLVWSLDTAGLRGFIQNIIDSTQNADSMLTAKPPLTLTSAGTVRTIALDPDTALAYRATSAPIDTSTMVSMNRDDPAIRGEKTFGGEIAVMQRLMVGTSSLPGTQPTRFNIQHDTASMRLGNAVVSVSDLSSQETWQLFESGIAHLPKQSSVHAYRSLNASLTAGLDTKIAYNAETWDTQSEFDTGTNYTFTARAQGIYLVTATAAVRAFDTNYVYLTIYKNTSQYSIGGIYRSIWNGYQHYAAASVTALVFLNANDTIDIRALSNRAATLVGTAEETRLDIVKLL